MADENFIYDERARCASITLTTGRVVRLSNVTREQAERFLERFRAEAARSGDRDPLSFHGPGGVMTRGGESHA